MTLLLAEGFDTRTAFTVGIWNPDENGLSKLSFVTGRSGSGYAMRGTGTSSSDGAGIIRTVTSSGTIIVGAALRYGTIPTGPGGWIPLAVSLNDTSGFVSLRVTSGGTVGVMTGSPANNQTNIGNSSTPFPVDGTTWQYVEIKIVAGTGTSGSVTVRQNGVQTLTLTGLNTGSTSLNQVSLRTACSGTSYHGTGTLGSIDDAYACNTSGSVNNDFLGDIRVYGIWPDGNGASSGLVGSDGNSTDNYALVDDAAAGVPVTTDYVGSATVGAKDVYTYTDIPGGAVVKGVQVDSYAAKSDTGAISGRNVATDGTNTVTGADAVLSTSYTGVSSLMETAPDGAAWTAAKVNATQFGWEVRT